MLAGVCLLCAAMLGACSDNNGNDPDPDPNPTPAGDIRYRGVNLEEIGTIRTTDAEATVRRLADWGVNHVRWTFLGNHPATQSMTAYLNWINRECSKLDAVMPLLKANGITVCIVIMTPPRDRDDDHYMRLFQVQADGADLQGTFIEGWRRIAEHYKNEDNVVFYDLLNEPGDGIQAPALLTNRTLFIETAKAIQAIDDTKKLVYEFGNDIDFIYNGNKYSHIVPIPLSNIVYNVHVYTPHLLTHQEDQSYTYPANIAGVYDWHSNETRYWDKAQLRAYLGEAINFIRNKNLEMYVGEFGCARWATNKGALNYLTDCLEIFEEEGWHWAYFEDCPNSASPGSNKWSLQFDDDINNNTPVPDDQPTERLLKFREYWAKNSD